MLEREEPQQRQVNAMATAVLEGAVPRPSTVVGTTAPARNPIAYRAEATKAAYATTPYRRAAARPTMPVIVVR